LASDTSHIAGCPLHKGSPAFLGRRTAGRSSGEIILCRLHPETYVSSGPGTEAMAAASASAITRGNPAGDDPALTIHDLLRWESVPAVPTPNLNGPPETDPDRTIIDALPWRLLSELKPLFVSRSGDFVSGRHSKTSEISADFNVK
jgi:hypothetical protein